jgi:hypothetical protein
VTPEGRVKAECKKIIAKYRNVHYIMPVAGLSVSGIHDYILCVAGRFLTVECKATEAQHMTPLQERFMLDVRAAGGCSLLIHAGNIDILETYLDLLGGIRK